MTLSTPLRAAVALLAIVPTVAACQAAAPHAGTILDRHDFTRPTARFELPGRLDEISGLAMTADGRLFGHDDERATVHEIDTATGEVGKRFSAGNPPVRGDFEGITIVGERFFLVTSTGALYELREVEDRAESPYRVTDTGLGASCEVEGLDYDPVDDALLFACKVSVPEAGVIVIARIPLDPSRGRLDPIHVQRNELPEHGVEDDFEASAIAVDPSGSLVLVSAPIESLIEIDRTGRVLAGIRLSRVWHPQPEGLAFGPDGTLYIADEQNGREAHVTTYATLRRRDPSR